MTQTLSRPLPEGVVLRDATVDDLDAINAIYNHYVATCTCTWQTQPDTLEQRRAWMDQHGPTLPVTVACLGGRVIGWGALSTFRSRAGIQTTVENSIYIHPDFHGRGIGGAMLAELIARAERLGYHSIVAVISADQPASLSLHAKMGFRLAGRLEQSGTKFGRWLDAIYMQLLLGPRVCPGEGSCGGQCPGGQP